jgi:hypothetical protein
MKTPLVYLDCRARRQAERLLPGRIAELEIQTAILDGRVRYGPLRVVGETWEVRVRRESGHLRPTPRAWRVLRINPVQNED